MSCRSLDLKPHRNVRSIDWKLYTLHAELNENAKTFRGLTYKETKTTILNRLIIIKKLFEEELEIVKPNPKQWRELDKCCGGIRIIIADINSNKYNELDLVSFKQINTEEIHKARKKLARYLDELERGYYDVLDDNTNK